MSALFVGWAVVVVALIGYPLVAGIVYRHLRQPVLPFVVGHHNRGPGHKFDCSPCEGEAAQWSFCACAQCWAATESRRALDKARSRAWWWPFTGLVWIPRRCFDAGADVTTTPTPNSIPNEPEPATKRARKA